MAERLIQSYSGRGNLVFPDNESADVIYRIDEYQDFVTGGQLSGLRSRRGRVSHANGHPDWHPLALAHRSPLTLVMDDGRKLKLLLKNLQGSVEASGDFF
jgi:hypothetical protein